MAYSYGWLGNDADEVSMRTFRPYDPDQALLLPPLLRDWLPESHLANFVSDVVDTLDLSPILAVYASQDGRGQPPYHPRLMVKLLVYGYCTGVVSSRKLERATWENLPFRVLTTDQHPDHDSIADFRQRHLGALAGLFLEVLRLCEKAGLVKLGQVAVDGTKLKANASKHKAMSYGRMEEKEEQLQAEIAALLERAAAVDGAEAAAEQAALGAGEDLPEELRRRESRLATIRAAKAELEAEARARAEEEAAAVREQLAERERTAAATGKKPRGRAPVAPDPEQAKPDPKAQKSFTDSESRIMKDGASGGFVQGYNAQAAVDGTAQVIVAAAVTQQANDQQQLVPMLTQTEENLGRMPEQGTADTGYFSAAAVSDPALVGIELYVPPPRRGLRKSGGSGAVATVALPSEASPAEQMRARLATAEGKAAYARRKAIVEPVFGQIKEERGFRRFSFRGLVKVTAEWVIVCLTHNLLKLFRSGRWQRPTWAAA